MGALLVSFEQFELAFAAVLTRRREAGIVDGAVIPQPLFFAFAFMKAVAKRDAFGVAAKTRG